MNLREVTIGRSSNCDIYLDARCQYASSVHATIFCNGNQLMFRDSSTNGTTINNIKVHKRIVSIHHGDTILIAGKYPISWNQIDSFFPNAIPSMTSQGTIIDSANPQKFQANQLSAISKNVVVASSYASTPNLDKWNWGAFFLSGLWGLLNGCWWIILVNIILYLLGIIPIITIFVGLGSIAFSVFCGMKGTRWAWKNKTWESVSDFERTQKNWATAGVIVFCISLTLLLISGFIFFAILSEV